VEIYCDLKDCLWSNYQCRHHGSRAGKHCCRAWPRSNRRDFGNAVCRGCGLPHETASEPILTPTMSQSLGKTAPGGLSFSFLRMSKSRNSISSVTLVDFSISHSPTAGQRTDSFLGFADACNSAVGRASFLEVMPA